MRLFDVLRRSFVSPGSFNGAPLLPTHDFSWRDGEEKLPTDFPSFVNEAVHTNGIIWGAIVARASLLSEALFTFQDLGTKALFGSPALGRLESPWPKGSAGDLITRMEFDVSASGNAYVVDRGSQLERLRPDWVKIVSAVGPSGARELVGYAYAEGGVEQNLDGAEVFEPSAVAHWAPQPHQLMPFIGSSWVTSVAREILGDNMMSQHKISFLRQGATPNLMIKYPASTQVTREVRQEIERQFEDRYSGPHNAGRTVVLDAGADIEVVGSTLDQLQFAATQGAGEARISVAARVPAVVLGIPEGLKGSALNSGNYTSAFRQFADLFGRPAWRTMCSSLETLISVPNGSRLWYDDSVVAALQQDASDDASIRHMDSQTVRTLLDAGFEPDAALEAVKTGDFSILEGTHSGLFSVQLQPPGQLDMPAERSIRIESDEVTGLPIRVVESGGDR